MNINDLHEKVLAGEREAEKKLFQDLTDSFLIFVEQKIWDKQDKKEVVQEALATIAAKYRDIEFTTSFSAWAYRVLEYKLMNYYRNKKKLRVDHDPSKLDSTAAPEECDPVLKLKLLECLRKVNNAYNRHARVLNLFYHGFNAEEICDRLNLTRNNFYIILSRARAMLKKCLQVGDIR